MFPEEIQCPHCQVLLELDVDERRSNQIECPNCKQIIIIGDIEDQSESLYAGFWIRLASVLIDGLIISVPYFFLVVILGLTSSHFSSETFLSIMLYLLLPSSLLVAFFYYSWLNANGRQTVGKKIFGLLVVDASDNPISFLRSLVRTVGYSVDSLIYSIGHLLMLITPKKQALHDLLTQSYVIRIKERAEREPRLILLTILGFIIISGFFFSCPSNPVLNIICIIILRFLEVFQKKPLWMILIYIIVVIIGQLTSRSC